MKDYLIAGQGLAGSLLALELIQRGHTVTLSDPSPQKNATNTAAGTYNPITGKRWALTWSDSILLPYAKKYYEAFEHEFGQTVHFSRPILRFFQSPDDLALIQNKSKLDPAYGSYIQEILTKEEIPKGLTAPWGAARLSSGGWVDTGLLTQTLRTHFTEKGILTQQAIAYDALEISPGKVKWNNETYKTIIFCEGYEVSQNPWFQGIPWRHAKGEVLTVEIPGLETTDIINAGAFILPIGNHRFKVGATYEWDDLDEIPTEHGKQQLLEKLEKICSLPITVLDHKAAVRPIAFDRAPVAGRHLEIPEVAILNGFGSKGVLYAPYYTKQLADHLDHDHPMDEKVSVATHWKPERCP